MNPDLVDNPFGGKVIYFPETESTMIDARKLGRSGPRAHGSVVVAGFQSAGRGRGRGRSWICPNGEGLLFTLVLADAPDRRPYGVTALPLRAGLALARVLEEDYHLSALVKWPNDVLVAGNKIAGILCEAYPGFQLLAMGINVGLRSAPSAAAEAAAPRWPATSLAAQTGGMTPHEELLTRVLHRVQAALANDHWCADLNARLFGADRTVRLVVGSPAAGRGNAVVGRVAGVTESGSIRIRRESDGRELSFPSGELELVHGSRGGEHESLR